MLHTMFFALISIVGSSNDSLSVVIEPFRETPIPLPAINFTSNKDPQKAFWLACGHTVIPIATGLSIAIIGSSNVEGSRAVLAFGSMTYGAAIGPSMGNFYARDFKRGLTGIGLRLVGAALFASGVAEAMADGNDDEWNGDSRDQDALMIGGVALVAGSTLWNILSAPTSARQYNARRGLSVSPYYIPHNRSYNVALRITF